MKRPEAEILVKQILVGQFAVFTYIVACPQTGAAAIIDSAGEADKLVDLVREEDLEVKYILNTHGHADHVLGNRQLKESFHAPTCMHGEDITFFSRDDVKAASLKEIGLPTPEPADLALNDGDILKVGMLNIQVIHTPGHTPGSVCYLVNGNLFTGDTLFVGAAGRTDLIGSSLEGLLESIEKKLLPLPRETTIWPGHDYGDTPFSTLGREMQENIYITDFILDGGG